MAEVANSPLLHTLASLPDWDEVPKSRRKKENHPELAPYQIDDSLGPVAAQSLVTYFDSEAGRDLVTRLEELQIDPASHNYAPKPEEAADKPLAGLTIVITGSLSKGRDEFKALIEENGGKVTGTVSKNTSFLLAGEGGGSKRDKAAKLGVTILSEEEFNEKLRA